MAIINDDLEAHFRAARGDHASFRKVASASSSSGASAVVVERRELAKVGIESRIVGGTSAYMQALEKRASMLRAAGADVVTSSPEVRNPLLSLINFYLPYDRKTLNQWIRYYVRMDPYVSNCVDLNSQFPISDFHFEGESDPQVIQLFEMQKERCHMLRHAQESSREEESIGEHHTFWTWDDDEGLWTDYTILNPDRLEITEFTWGSETRALYELDPPEELKAKMRSSDPRVQDILSSYDPAVLEALQANRPIQLDPQCVTSLMRKASPYDARGTSPIMSALKCFVPGTRVTMADGRVCPIEEVIVGDLVLSGEGQPTQVIRTHRISTTEKVVKLRDALCNEVEATVDHKMYVFRGVRRESCPKLLNAGPCGEVSSKTKICQPSECDRFKILPIREIAAGDVQIGDYLASPIPQISEHTRVDADPWLLGYFLGNGSSMGEWQIGIAGPWTEHGAKCLARVQAGLAALGVRKMTVLRADSQVRYEDRAQGPFTSWRLNFCQQDVRQKLEAWFGGLVCKTKRLGLEILNLVPSQLAEFVQGWIDADGHQTPEGTERVSSANEGLAHQLRYVLLRLGIPSSITLRYQDARSFGPGKPIWCIAFRRAPRQRHRFEVFVQNGYVFSKVVAREECDYVGDVHCVTVEDESHTFIASGVKVRNCLMYKDKLVEAQYAIADQQITPVQLWKIGDPASNFMPDEAKLQAFRALLQAGRHDPNFTIVSHAAIELELIGYTGKLLPILPELDWVSKQIMVALYTNDATITGSGPSFGAAVVPFKILQGRYQLKRDRMVDLYRSKILHRVAKEHEIFTTTPAMLSHRYRNKAKQIPRVPKIGWNFKLDLTDSSQKMNFIIQLRDKNQLPMKVVCDLLNLDYDTVKKWQKNEEGSVFDPAYQEARMKRAKDSGIAPGGAGSDLAAGMGLSAVPGGAGGGNEGGEGEAGGAAATGAGEGEAGGAAEAA